MSWELKKFHFVWGGRAYIWLHIIPYTYAILCDFYFWPWLSGIWINDLKEAIWTGRNNDKMFPHMWKRLMCSSKSAYSSTAVPYRKHPIMLLKCPIKRVKEKNSKPESRKGGARTSHMPNSEQGHLLESHSQTINTGVSFQCMKLFNK